VEPVVEAAPEPVPEPVVEPVVEAAPEPVPETVPEPVVETPTASEEHMVDLSDYTTPEYLEMVKKLIAPNDTDQEPKETSKKTFKIPGYTSIQMSNTSKQPRRKSMTFV
jgi:hypothetical protein